MADRNTTVKAIVTLTVEIHLPDAWGGDCAMSQVSKQARRAAAERIELVRAKDGVGLVRDYSVRIVGDPVVKAVIVEEGP